MSSLYSTELPVLVNPSYGTTTATSLELVWEVTFDGNDEISNCTYYYSISGSDIITSQSVETEGRSSLTVDGLSPYNTYFVNLTCDNTVGTSNLISYPSETTYQAGESFFQIQLILLTFPNKLIWSISKSFPVSHY